MSNLFFALPLPVGNGPGAAVVTSGMGQTKTFIVAGSFPGSTIIVEASVDGGIVYAPVVVFQDGDRQQKVDVAADHMRTRVSGRKSSVPFTATIEVGSSNIGGLFADIPMPVGNGPGAAVDVSAFGLFTTIISGGSFQGAAIVVEISDDNIDWAPLVTFAGQGGLLSEEVTANWIRANVSGRKGSVPFTGSLAIGAINNATASPGVVVLATITARITDDTTGTITGGSFSIFAAGQAGSISLLGVFDDVPDDNSNFTLELKVSSGTVRIRSVTRPDSEDAALAVNNIAVGTFIQGDNDNLAVDFSTSSNTFVTLLAVNMTPAAATDLQLFASINFTWVP